MTEINAKNVVIAGGTGLLGQALARTLESAGCRATVLSRHEPTGPVAGRWLKWDARTPSGWPSVLENADAVVNLTGRSVDCRKTPDRCDEILRSRVDSVRAIGEAIRSCDNPPPVWVQASTAHIYGDPPDTVCDEASSMGYGLAPFVAEHWEAALAEACPDATRSVLLRTSFVLSAEGGAFPVLRRLARLGLGGRIGSGRQWISWLHIHDMTRIMLRAIEDPAMSGVYAVTAPRAAKNCDFMRALRHAVGVPFGLPAPGWMVRLGAATLIDTDPELALYGRNIVPTRLLAEGFVFQHAGLDEALADLIGSKRRAQAA